MTDAKPVRFLDAELRPIPLGRGLVAMSMVGALLLAGLLVERMIDARPGASLALAPGYVFGVLSANAGITLRTPKAFWSSMLVAVVVIQVIKAVI